MKKKSPKKYRNPAAIPAKSRGSAGPMHSKKEMFDLEQLRKDLEEGLQEELEPSKENDHER